MIQLLQKLDDFNLPLDIVPLKVLERSIIVESLILEEVSFKERLAIRPQQTPPLQRLS